MKIFTFSDEKKKILDMGKKSFRNMSLAARRQVSRNPSFILTGGRNTEKYRKMGKPWQIHWKLLRFRPEGFKVGIQTISYTLTDVTPVT